MKYEDGFYWARPVIESEESPAQIVELKTCDFLKTQDVYAICDEYDYKLEDWVILEKVERKQ